LAKHKAYLRTLQTQKEENFVETLKLREEKEQLRRHFVDKLAKKRAKVRGAESAYNEGDSPKRPAVPAELPPQAKSEAQSQAKPAKLTEKNLKAYSEQEERKSRASARPKPQWAVSQKEQEDIEEQDVDELLSFVNDLDYDKYIEDMEVRQALAIIKDRVDEIRKDDEWKRKIVDMYNQDEGRPKTAKSVVSKADKSDAGQSDASIKSFVSKARSQIEDEQRERDSRKGGWDHTVRAKQTKSDAVSVTAEERVAKLVADQVLQAQPVSPTQRLKGVHSNLSIRKLLEREAVKQLTAFREPVISVIQEKGRKVAGEDVSNLPYLHRNPAV
jgi:hypothetical protein